jgi:hypothetical protein
MQADNWHYPRPALAQDYLATFDRGLTTARGLFARRRMGKTEFLEKDLMPAARQAGYQTAYVNLWDNRENPELALVSSLYAAAVPTGMAKLAAKFNLPVKKLKASAKLPGLVDGSMEAEMGETAGTVANTLLGAAMRMLDDKKKRMLLVIDEAQVLALPGNSSFAHALRTALDSRKDYIKVVFAGSSETTLRAMFGRSSEPFYNWAALEPFQLLNRDFVEAMVEKVNNLSKYPLSVVDALVAFKELGSTPEFFRRYLERYLTHAMDGPAAALAHTKTHVFDSDTFKHLWGELLPADQFILDKVATGDSDLYSATAREKLAHALGLAEVSTSTVQNAVTRLAKRNIMTSIERGRYQFEDEAFATWVAERKQEL